MRLDALYLTGALTVLAIRSRQARSRRNQRGRGNQIPRRLPMFSK